MKVLRIDKTEETPAVLFDKAQGVFEISGRSLPEDSADFYTPIMKWVSEYKQSPNANTEFVIKLDYFNTASSKFIQDILELLEDVPGAKVIWYVLEDDEDMEMTGHEFSELVEIPFEFKSY